MRGAPELVEAVAALDEAVAAARTDVLLAAGPLALALVGWAVARRRRRVLVEHAAAVDAIVAEAHDVSGPVAEDPDRQDGGLIDVDELAAMYERGERGV